MKIKLLIFLVCTSFNLCSQSTVKKDIERKLNKDSFELYKCIKYPLKYETKQLGERYSLFEVMKVRRNPKKFKIYFFDYFLFDSINEELIFLETDQLLDVSNKGIISLDFHFRGPAKIFNNKLSLYHSDSHMYNFIFEFNLDGKLIFTKEGRLVNNQKVDVFDFENNIMIWIECDGIYTFQLEKRKFTKVYNSKNCMSATEMNSIPKFTVDKSNRTVTFFKLPWSLSDKKEVTITY